MEVREQIKKILLDFGEQSVVLLRQYHLEAGQRASGETYESFKTEQEETGDGIRQIVYGADHVYFLEYGRGAGGFPPLDRIKLWCEQKGLFNGVEKQYQKNSIAYLVGRKIAQSGTLLNRTGRTFSGYESPIGKAFDEARVQELQDQIEKHIEVIINSEVLKAYDSNNNKTADG